MRPDDRDMRAIGALMQRGIPDAPDPHRAQVLRDRILDRRHQTVIASPVGRWRRAAAVAALLLAVGAAVYWGRTPRRLDVVDTASARPVAVGAWHRSGERTATWNFENLGRVTLLPRSVVRAVTATTRRVVVELSAGEVLVAVRPKSGADWQVHAGPYAVHVTGTEFSVQWTPSEGTLHVAVTRGRVFVRNASHPASSVYVSAAHGLTATVEGDRYETYALGDRSSFAKVSDLSEDTAPPRVPSDTASAPSDTAPVSAGASPRRPRQAATAPRPDIAAWSQLYDAGAYDAVLAHAKDFGVSQLIATQDAPLLWKLANAARYAGDAPTALRLLDALRSRFPDDKHAPLATYLTGRIHLDLRHDTRAAYRWFAAFLRDNPQSALSDEVMGRLMGLCLNLGKTDEAVTLAQRYMRTHKGGLYTRKARAIIQRYRGSSPTQPH